MVFNNGLSLLELLSEDHSPSLVEWYSLSFFSESFTDSAAATILNVGHFILTTRSVQIQSYFCSVFSCIWTICIFSSNTGKYRPEITLYFDTFHAVSGMLPFHICLLSKPSCFILVIWLSTGTFFIWMNFSFSCSISPSPVPTFFCSFSSFSAFSPNLTLILQLRAHVGWLFVGFCYLWLDSTKRNEDRNLF